MMATELNVNKYITATVHGSAVTLKDEQHGQITLSAENFERIYSEYLKEKNPADWVREIEQ